MTFRGARRPPAALLPVLFSLALLAAACSAREKIPENTLVVAMESAPATLDPRLSTGAAAAKVGDLLFNGLVKRRDDLTIAPDIAESWETPDGTTYVFHLRPGVFFHDGRKLTAADVKSTYEFILDEKNGSAHRGNYEVIDSIAAPDDTTVVFRLKEPNAPFLGNLTMGIVPAGAGEETAEAPVGTGPFRLMRFKSDERIELAANRGYFEGAPALDGVILKIIPDETVRTLALERGSVHVIMNPITPDLLPRFRRDPDLRVVTRPGTNYSYLGFNMEDPLTGDRAVRLAIAHAIDRKSIIKHILKKLAVEAAGPVSPASVFYEKDAARYEHDPEKAKRILDEAGYKDPDGEGPATRFTLKYNTSQNELRKRIAEVFQWQLGRVGIGLDIRSYEWGVFYSDIKKGAFQMYSLTWVGITDPDILHYIFHSSSAPPAGANRGRYKNQRVDELLTRGRVTFGEERKRIYSEAQKILARDLPYVSLWYPVNVAVLDRRVKGLRLAPDENLRSLKDVRIEQGR
ncbi:MAG: ABC transporter substrate-binding protein [Candidatus Nitrospinota bacterium M3_3B_026]